MIRSLERYHFLFFPDIQKVKSHRITSLVRQYGLVIPSQMDAWFSDEIRKDLAGYVLVPCREGSDEIFHRLKSSFGSSGIDLGTLGGQDIAIFLNGCLSKSHRRISVGGNYRVLAGSYSGLVVRADRLVGDNRQVALVSFDMPRCRRSMLVPVGCLSEVKGYPNLQETRRDLVKEQVLSNRGRSVILDLNYILDLEEASLNRFSRIEWVYYTILKAKQLLAEYQPLVVVRNNCECDEHRWAFSFSLALGFDVFLGSSRCGVTFFRDLRVKDLGDEHCVVWSGRVEPLSLLVDPQVTLYRGRGRGRHGGPEHITQNKLAARFNLSKDKGSFVAERLPWLWALFGDSIWSYQDVVRMVGAWKARKVFEFWRGLCNPNDFVDSVLGCMPNLVTSKPRDFEFWDWNQESERLGNHYSGEYNPDMARDLLCVGGLAREIEMWAKVDRIFQSRW